MRETPYFRMACTARMLLVTGASTAWNFLWNAMLSFSPSQHRSFTCGGDGNTMNSFATHPAHLVSQRLRRGRRHGLVAEGVALLGPERQEPWGEGGVLEQVVEVRSIISYFVSEFQIQILQNVQPIHPALRAAFPACRRRPSSCPARGAPVPLHSSWRRSRPHGFRCRGCTAGRSVGPRSWLRPLRQGSVAGSCVWLTFDL